MTTPTPAGKPLPLTAQATLAHYQREAEHAADLAELKRLREEVALLKADAERYRHLRNLAIEQTGMPGQPCIAMPNGMKSGYYLTEETADHAVDTSISEAALAASKGN